MKRGILGGTFDPIHVAHLRMAIEAKEAFGLDEVVLEVAHVSPFKLDYEAAPPEARLQMVSLAVEGTPGLVAGRTEIDRPPPSFAVDTLEAHAGHDLVLILGADSLADLPAWREPERVATLARLAACSRPGFPLEEVVRALPELFARRVEPFSAPLLDVSSTDLRRRLREGRSVRYLIPDSVIRFIEETRLYL
ncbi:MAG: nicotinate (nicotinamide) nucleotide adenylyltransferase [Armatimonadota bacterium]